jgi:hypothetical protein
MAEEHKSQTIQTVERLRAIADELEALAEEFPNLSWHRAFHKDLWNGDRETIHRSGCYYKVMVDKDNIGRATHVQVGSDQVSAHVELESLSRGIPVLYIHGLVQCTSQHDRDQIVEVVEMLPEHLRYPVYRRMARIHKKDREDKRQKKAQLLRELEELEGEP